MRALVAGNWKMHGTSADLGEIVAIANASRAYPGVDVALCVPATLVHRASESVPGFAIGAQDVHHVEKGAHTGCISTAMLKDAGAGLTIVGHSERREAQRETDPDIRAKAKAALSAGLQVILCVGESLEVREAGRAVEAVVAQLEASLPSTEFAHDALAIAYEPIWAIGTGKVAGPADIAEMHSALRDCLLRRFGEGARDVRILYGGSVKASNAAQIFAIDNVDGALVGGASLTAADFVPIVAAAAATG